MALHARADLKTENLGTRTAVTTRTQNSSTDRSYGKGLPQVHPMHLVTVRNDEAITSDKESIKETV